MKKLFLTLALAACALGANAQWVLGGNLNFNTNSGNSEVTLNGNSTTIDGTTTRSLTIAPKVGYWLNDKMQVGASFGLTHNHTITPIDQWLGVVDVDGNTTTKQTNWFVSPYLRYNVFSANKLSFFVEGALNFAGTGKSSWESEGSYTVLGNTTNFDETGDNSTTAFSYGLSIVPGLNYKANEHVSLDLYLNMAGLAWNHTATTVGDDDNKTVTSENNFGLNCSTKDLSVTSINNVVTLGFNYAF